MKRLCLVITSALILILVFMGCSQAKLPNLPTMPSLNVTPNVTKAVVENATKGEETLQTYKSTAFAYSIQYPSTWTLEENLFGTGEVLISHGDAYISISPPFKGNPTGSVSGWVDFQIRENSKGSMVYRVLQRSILNWQGKYEACLWILENQYAPSYTFMKSTQLNLKRDDNFYQISGGASESNYEQYSSTINKIILSFQLTQ